MIFGKFWNMHAAVNTCGWGRLWLAATGYHRMFPVFFLGALERLGKSIIMQTKFWNMHTAIATCGWGQLVLAATGCHRLLSDFRICALERLQVI